MGHYEMPLSLNSPLWGGKFANVNPKVAEGTPEEDVPDQFIKPKKPGDDTAEYNNLSPYEVMMTKLNDAMFNNRLNPNFTNNLPER